jgi:hypothetical protein
MAKTKNKKGLHCYIHPVVIKGGKELLTKQVIKMFTYDIAHDKINSN